MYSSSAGFCRTTDEQQQSLKILKLKISKGEDITDEK